jgi:hypothetical protein
LSRSTQPNARCPESPDLSMVCEHVKNIAAEAAPTAARRSAAVAPPQRAGTRCFWRGVSFSRVTLSSTSTAPQERREQPEGRRAGCPESRNATRSHGCVRKTHGCGLLFARKTTSRRNSAIPAQPSPSTSAGRRLEGEDFESLHRGYFDAACTNCAKRRNATEAIG